MVDPQNPQIRTSIVIPCRNEASTIGDLLRFLIERTEGDCEILVADGRSNDGTREIIYGVAREHPRVRLVDNPRQLTSAGLNAAIRQASGEIIIRVDAHTRYADDYIDACIAVLSETGADNVGGPQLAEADGYMAGAVAAACHSPVAVGGARIHDPHYEGPTDSVIYGCWRRSIFDHTGLFDEELVRNQDGEHNYRIIKSGGLVWQTPRIRSWYRPRGNPLVVARQYMQYGYWKAREIQKMGRVRHPRQLVPGVFVSMVLALCPFIVFSITARVALITLLGSYIVFLAAATLHLCVREGTWRWLPLIPVVFASMQLGYGYGFIRGVWNFWIRRRTGQPAFRELTR